jgi:hypothetical protein
VENLRIIPQLLVAMGDALKLTQGDRGGYAGDLRRDVPQVPVLRRDQRPETRDQRKVSWGSSSRQASTAEAKAALSTGCVPVFWGSVISGKLRGA